MGRATNRPHAVPLGNSTQACQRLLRDGGAAVLSVPTVPFQRPESRTNTTPLRVPPIAIPAAPSVSPFSSPSEGAGDCEKIRVRAHRLSSPWNQAST